MKSILVIGLGLFGGHLAEKLTQLGNEVMVIDKDEELVNKLSDRATSAQIGDCMNSEVIKSLGVSNFDICFVCTADFQASLEITSLLKENGAKLVISKTDSSLHAKFLSKIGADEIIYPERDMAVRAAVRYSAKNAFDYIKVSDDYALMEIEIPGSWKDKSLAELDIRKKHNVNVIGKKLDGKMLPVTGTGEKFCAGDHVVLAGSNKDLIAISAAK